MLGPAAGFGQGVCFEEGELLPSGRSPSGAALGDLDDDGDLDLATTSSGGELLRVRLGGGDGTFGAPVTYPLPDSPRTVKLGDLDGDGALDAAVACETGSSVAVLGNGGSGAFGATVAYSLGTDLPAGYWLDLADFDADGDLDVAATASKATFPRVQVFKNLGDGTLELQLSLPTGAGPRSVVAADLDANGSVDVASANSGSSTASIFLNAWPGFVAQGALLTGPTPFVIDAGDLDGDGDVDLATADHGLFSTANTVSVFANAGDATFAAATALVTSAGCWFVELNDLDHDGDRDIVATSFTTVVRSTSSPETAQARSARRWCSSRSRARSRSLSETSTATVDRTLRS